MHIGAPFEAYSLHSAAQVDFLSPTRSPLDVCSRHTPTPDWPAGPTRGALRSRGSPLDNSDTIFRNLRRRLLLGIVVHFVDPRQHSHCLGKVDDMSKWRRRRFCSFYQSNCPSSPR